MVGFKHTTYSAYEGLMYILVIALGDLDHYSIYIICIIIRIHIHIDFESNSLHVIYLKEILQFLPFSQ